MHRAVAIDCAHQLERYRAIANAPEGAIEIKDEAKPSVAGRSVRKEPVNILMIGSYGSVYNCAAPYICENPYKSCSTNILYLPRFQKVLISKLLTDFNPEQSTDGRLKIGIIECDFRNHTHTVQTNAGLDEVSVSSLDISKYQDLDHICLVSEFQNYQAESSAIVQNIKKLIHRIFSATKNDKLKLSFMYVGVDKYSESEEDCFTSLESVKARRYVMPVGNTRSIVKHYMPDVGRSIYQLIGPLFSPRKGRNNAKTTNDAQKEAAEFFRGTRDLTPVNAASGESAVPTRAPKRKLEEDNPSARKLAKNFRYKTNNEQLERARCTVM